MAGGQRAVPSGKGHNFVVGGGCGGKGRQQQQQQQQQEEGNNRLGRCVHHRMEGPNPVRLQILLFESERGTREALLSCAVPSVTGCRLICTTPGISSNNNLLLPREQGCYQCCESYVTAFQFRQPLKTGFGTGNLEIWKQSVRNIARYPHAPQQARGGAACIGSAAFQTHCGHSPMGSSSGSPTRNTCDAASKQAWICIFQGLPTSSSQAKLLHFS